MAFLGQSSIVQSEIDSFWLTFHKKHKEMVFNSYFPFILDKSKCVKEKRKTLKLYTIYYDIVGGRKKKLRQNIGLKIKEEAKLIFTSTLLHTTFAF